MFWKLLLTAAVILGAYQVIRARMGQAAPPERKAPESKPLPSPRLVHTAAYGLLALMLGGTALYLAQGWIQGREILRVQVMNANTGTVTSYRARRRDIEGRGFRTLEGQVVLVADVERIILTPADRQP